MLLHGAFQIVLAKNYNHHQRQINHCCTKVWQCLASVQIYQVESAAVSVFAGWCFGMSTVILLGSLIYGGVNHHWTYDVMIMAVATIFQF